MYSRSDLSPVTVTMMYCGELLWPLLFWAAGWEQRASCPAFETDDGFGAAMDVEAGGISDRKWAAFADEGAVAAGVAMVTALAC